MKIENAFGMLHKIFQNVTQKSVLGVCGALQKIVTVMGKYVTNVVKYATTLFTIIFCFMFQSTLVKKSASKSTVTIYVFTMSHFEPTLKPECAKQKKLGLVLIKCSGSSKGLCINYVALFFGGGDLA